MRDLASTTAVSGADAAQRLKRLAAEKASLELVLLMMRRLDEAVALEGTVGGLLRAVLEVIGGTQVCAYYWIDGVAHRADALGEPRELGEIDDPLVRRVILERTVVEQASHFGETRLLTPPFMEARTWVFPLSVGDELVGVMRLDGMQLATHDLRGALPTFLGHAALVLKAHLQTQTRLQQAHDALAREVEVRTGAEAALRAAKDGLEATVREQTRDLLGAKARLEAELAERLRAEGAVRASEQRFRTVFDSAPVPIWEEDFTEVRARLERDGVRAGSDLRARAGRDSGWLRELAGLVRIVAMNERTLSFFGVATRDEVWTWLPDYFGDEALAVFAEELATLLDGRDTFECEIPIHTMHGRDRQLWLTLHLGPGARESWNPVFVSFIDLTDRKALEEQLRQVQRLEAIGQLAGGVAHDFNNILAAITLNLNLLLGRPDLDEAMRDSLSEMSREAGRAADVTRQLLMFGRRAILHPESIDLNDVLARQVAVLRRLIPGAILLEFSPCASLPRVKADRTMVEQVVLNLVLNARDAMPQGGVLSLRLETIEAAPDRVRPHPPAVPGPHVCLAVGDTGRGMDEATRARIFEPFFSTKDPAGGPGLGLATVDGIVAQHGGWLEVESAPGRGSTFRVFLPALPRIPAPVSGGSREGRAAAKGTVLLVEDEPTLRRVVLRGLSLQGFRVLEAGGVAEALAIWKREAGSIDLLHTDMVLPGGVSGLDLAHRLRSEKPALKVILTSGYHPDFAGLEDPAAPPGFAYLPKPYSMAVLSGTVTRLLGG